MTAGQHADERPTGLARLNPVDEPAVFTGGAMGLFAALVTVAAAFGWIHWSGAQLTAVLGVAVIVVPVMQGLITRQFVRPVARSVPKPGGKHRVTAPDPPAAAAVVP